MGRRRIVYNVWYGDGVWKEKEIAIGKFEKGGVRY